MSKRLSPRPSPAVTAGSGVRGARVHGDAPRFRAGRATSLTALVFLAGIGCSNAGSSFDGTGGAGPPSGTGGSATASGGSNGSGAGTGGSSVSGTGGSNGAGTGGDSANGSGGEQGSSTGGAGPATGTGGSSSGSGGGSSNSGGANGTAGRAGTGGAMPGTGGATPGTGGAGGTVTAACPKGAGAICHEFIANDNGRNQINYVNEFDPTKNWTKPVGDTGANSPRTIEIVDNTKAKTGKAILVSLEKGYGEFDLQDGTLLVRVSNKSGVSGACRMPDGNTALGTNASIIVVNASGTEVKRITLPAGDELRAINRNPADGHFWFSKVSMVYDMAESGAVNWMGNMGAGTKGYAVWWRAGGGAYATTGDPSTVVEMDSTGKVLNTVGGKAMFTSVGLDFFSGFVRLSNGNFVVANWLGHLSSPGANTPHVVEFTPQNKVAWQWGNQTLARQITNVYVFR